MKVCLIMDSRMRRRQSHEEIRNIAEAFEVSLVLLDKTYIAEEYFNKGVWTRVREVMRRLCTGRFTALIALEDMVASWVSARERNILRRLAYLNDREDVFTTVPALSSAEVVEFEPVRVNRFRYDFDLATRELIESKADVIVLEGFNNILTGDALETTTYGVISGHGADIRRYRGRPHGFFQWINGERTVGASIQRLTNELDGGYLILCEHTDVSLARSWAEVRLALLEIRGNLFQKALMRLTQGNFEPGPKGTGQLTREKDANRFGNSMRCLWKNLRSRYLGRNRAG